MTLEERVSRRREGLSKEINMLLKEKWVLDEALLHLRTGEPASIVEARINHRLGGQNG